MTQRILGPTGGPRRKRLAFLLPFVALAALILAIGASAGPSTDAGFQGSDGNLIDDGAGIDWNSFDPVQWSGGTAPYRTASEVDLGWEFTGIEDAADDGNDTVFGGGTKQDDKCASVGSGPKPPNKDDLERIYVASAVVSSKTYLALAWVRIPQNTTSASAHVAFEFNQSNTACGGSADGLVQRTPDNPATAANDGDMLVVYDFEGGAATPTLKLLRWQTTGTCEQTGKAATAVGCWVFQVNLTSAGFAEARVNVGSTALDALAPPAAPDTASVDDTLGDSEFGEAIIDLTGAGVFPATPTTCLTFGKVFGVSRSSGNSGTAAMKDLAGPGSISISNCGQVIIRKQTIPDGDTTTDFTFSTNVQTLPGPAGVANFTLKDNGVKTISNVQPNTARTVTEADPSTMYALTSIDCSASTVPTANISTSVANRTVTFSIASEETLDCTFTNTRQKLQSTMDTAPWIYPNDKATVKANAAFTDITGSVKFRLYDSSVNCNATTPSDTVGTGGLLYKETVNLSATAGTSKTVNTDNKTIKVEADAVVYWLVEYGGDSNHFGRVSKCVENIDVDLTGDTGGTNVP